MTAADNDRDGRLAEGEATIRQLEGSRAELRERGRRLLGLTDEPGTTSLRTAIRSSGASWYPLVALSALILIDQFQTSGFTILAPDIAQTLGISVSTVSGLLAIQSLALALGTLPMAAYTQRVPRRAAVAVVTAFGWAVFTLFTGYAAGAIGLAFFLAANGASSGSVRAVHVPLLFDSYPPGTRGRLYSAYLSIIWASLVAGPAVVGALAVLDLTWRGTFIVMGGISLAVVLVALRLRDPGFGRFDTRRLRAAARGEIDGQGGARTAPRDQAAEVPDTSLRFFEVLRRLLLVATVRRYLAAYVVLGMMLSPLVTFLSFYLDDRWDQGPVGRALFSVTANAMAIPLLLISGRYIERLLSTSPARLTRLAGILLGGGIVTVDVAIILPVYALVVVVAGIGLAAFAVALAASGAALNSMIPAQMRVHAAGITNLALYGAGALVGQIFLAGIYQSSGPTIAILALAVPGAIAGAVMYRAGRDVDSDLDGFIDQVIEDERLETLVAGGHRLPMLSCRGLDFAYDGGLQVLFDVALTVDEGEMVCLLGTNGAGKSTLLNVISGLSLPQRGAVRLTGLDITYLDPARRIRLGIEHISGGHATFPDLTVIENLRAFGYTLGGRRAVVEARLDGVFEVFPALAARRNSRAGLLSGGENQMLALSRALIHRPRLLLLDELSLGLAPKVVGELFETVRGLNADGVAIVLVEQSVNIALSLASHAYFLERGQVRFDGPAAELAERADLLRSVFLHGTAKMLGAERA
jgi:ABC-type branched-subunit amino acid transport system ATPase component